MHREWFLFDKPRRCGAIYSDAVQSWKPFFMLRPAWLDLLQCVHIFFRYCHFCTPCFAVQRPQLNQLEQNEMRYATVLQIIEDRYVVVYGFNCPARNVYTGKYVIHFLCFSSVRSIVSVLFEFARIVSMLFRFAVEIRKCVWDGATAGSEWCC